ncbi:MAG: glutamine synthetase family protein [bacterium]
MKNHMTLEVLKELVDGGKVDTIIVAFPDHLGRLLGKRVTGSYFLNHMISTGMHACNYLLSSDMEMNPLPGFKMASWDQGYGDFHGAIDLGTLRLLPWLEGTALVMTDLQWDDGRPVAESPRAILKDQIERAREAGIIPMMGSELEFYLFCEAHDDISSRGFVNPTPTSEYIIDYHILHSTRDEPVIREIRNAMCEAHIPVEFSKGEWGKGQHEINLLYAEALEMADRHVIYKNGVKEIAWSKGYSATFMAKYDTSQAGSGFHIHTSVTAKSGKKSLFWDSRKKEGSKMFRQFLGGLLQYSRELYLFYASTVNAYKRYRSGSFAPTRIVWSHDNRTTGYRILGHGPSFRIENRMPGADSNPYLAFAATIAAGLAGINENLDCGDPYEGDAYKAADLPHLPPNLSAATDALEKSQLARKAFGDSVVDHYVRLARFEQNSYDAVVTDWEKRRYFDQI